MTPEIVYLLSSIFKQKVDQWLGAVGSDVNDEVRDAMETSLLTIKILRRLLIAGYEFPGHDKVVQEFWSAVQAYFGRFLEIGKLEYVLTLEDFTHHAIISTPHCSRI